MAETPSAVDVATLFARRLREARDAKDWTQQDLADRMRELGYPMDRASIAKIERRAPSSRHRGGSPRRVSIEEALGFAAALGVAPVSLFCASSLDEFVAIAPKLQLPRELAAMWLEGIHPLRSEDAERYENSRGFQFERDVIGEIEAALRGEQVADDIREVLLRDDVREAVGGRLEHARLWARREREAIARRRRVLQEHRPADEEALTYQDEQTDRLGEIERELKQLAEALNRLDVSRRTKRKAPQKRRKK